MLQLRQPRHHLVMFILVLLVMAATAVQAQSIYSEYERGTLFFEYSQWPYGGFNGSFTASGLVWNDDLSFPEGQTSGCGGGLNGAADDTTQAVAVGLITNPDGTRDAALVFVTFPSGPAAGSYAVDTETMSVGFVWIDNVVNLTIPETGSDYQAWFDNLEADHKFVSTSGEVIVKGASENGFAGIFHGMMADPDNYTIISVENGQFSLEDVPMAPVTPDADMQPGLLSAVPNPFNPQTTVKLSLDRAENVSVSVFDLAGRLVARLHRGPLAAGDHRWVWNGRNAAGLPQGGGVYFCLAEGPGWHNATKLVLVP